MEGNEGSYAKHRLTAFTFNFEARKLARHVCPSMDRAANEFQ